MSDPESPTFRPTSLPSRREALGGIGAAAALLVACPPRVARAQSGTTFTPEMFGARGDGRTDDYEALKRLAAAVSQAGGGIVRFGRGRHYLIDRIQVWGGPNRNDVANILYNRCRGLRIDLNGATVHVKGDFHRSGDTAEGRFSWLNAVIPFQLNRCTDVVIENGFLHGHADRMSRDPTVDERSGHGFAINGCSNVLLEGLHVHHFSADGVRVGILGGRENDPCRDVRLSQVRLTNNARQGLTIAGGVGVVATDCEFSHTGRTGGAQGDYRHAPSAGVDVEPNRFVTERSDFRALRCRFDDNRGSPVTAASADRTAFIELIDCSGRSRAQSRLSPRVERAVIRGGTWHNIQIACAYAGNRAQRPTSIDVSGGTWSGDDPAWAPVYDLSPRHPNVRIHGNRFELRSTRPFTTAWLFQCSNPNHQFEDNQVFVSARGHDGAGEDMVGNFRGARLVRGNRWATDLAAPRRFVNDYGGAQRVERETFSGAFARTGAG
ncbi:MAG TPA: hypothetical protein VN231_00940 [Allosphingosinicella sp.]|nr:hypothetical protein [Allosphingosinicella sp.]